MPHTTPPEEPTTRLKPYQKKALLDAENHFKQGIGILKETFNKDIFLEAEKHTNELFIIIHNIKYS